MPEFHHGCTRIHWETIGEGEPVAFLNGVLMTFASWKLQTVEISRRYSCLMHDFRGQLLSSKPKEPWTLENHAEDFRALLDHLGIDSCHLVGTSYGGEAGMIFAALFPERVRSLTVISSVSEIGQDTDQIVLDWRKAALEAPEELYRTMMPKTFAPKFVADNPTLIEQSEERILACDTAFFEAFAGLIDAFRQLHITPMLGAVRCPSLVMVGELDRIKPPRYSRIIADAIKDSEYIEISGAGHAVILEQPDVVNPALLAFIQKHTRS